MFQAALRARLTLQSVAKRQGATAKAWCSNASVSSHASCGRVWHTSRPILQAFRNFRTSVPRWEPAKGDGISQDITYNNFFEQVMTFPKRKPFATNVIVATVKTSLADIIVQLGEGKERIDYKRNAVFVGFGCFYLGVVQWFIYVTVFSRLCPHAVRFANLPWKEKLRDRAGQIDLVKQTVLDNFVHYTFIYFPVFYTFKELLQGSTLSLPSPETVKSALAKYWNNCVVDNLAMWGLWVPFDMIIYAVPIWMRLPLNHAVSLAWTMILSSMRGAS
mmetsp:Transcript_26064/g.60218  ORF Transcript_26064/g.60218 Transcript_26064/m.60218 type:complete len:275 (-) Transcript_26064:48-872(-)